MARSRIAQDAKAPISARLRTVRTIEDAAPDAPATAIALALRAAALDTRATLRPRSVAAC